MTNLVEHVELLLLAEKIFSRYNESAKSYNSYIGDSLTVFARVKHAAIYAINLCKNQVNCKV